MYLLELGEQGGRILREIYKSKHSLSLKNEWSLTREFSCYWRQYIYKYYGKSGCVVAVPVEDNQWQHTYVHSGV